MTAPSSGPETADELLRRWTAELGAGAADAGRDVLRRYAEPHRRYHDHTHLLEVLVRLEQLADPVPTEVVCAAFFHDAVYAGTPDDEERSADLAADVLSGLGRPRALVHEVARLVRVTAAHAPEPGDVAGALLCDADLGVLAAAPQRYAAYVDGVRAEYAHLDDGAFRAGRAAVLRGLVDRPRLFLTEAARERWEADARRNVADELARLTADGAARPP